MEQVLSSSWEDQRVDLRKGYREVKQFLESHQFKIVLEIFLHDSVGVCLICTFLKSGFIVPYHHNTTVDEVLYILHSQIQATTILMTLGQPNRHLPGKRLTLRANGGGTTLDYGAYCIQFALMVFGHEMPQRVSVTNCISSDSTVYLCFRFRVLTYKKLVILCLTYETCTVRMYCTHAGIIPCVLDNNL